MRDKFEAETMRWIHLWKVALLLQEHDITLKYAPMGAGEYIMDCAARFPYLGGEMTYSKDVFKEIKDVPFDILLHELWHLNTKELETYALDRHATAQQIDKAEERLVDRTKKVIARLALVALYLIGDNSINGMEKLVSLLSEFDAKGGL